MSPTHLLCLYIPLPWIHFTECSNLRVSIGQSKTIERFVARKFGLFGSTDIESAYIDMCMEHVRDIKLKYTDIRKGLSGEELEAAKLAFVTGELGTWLTKIEKVRCICI